MKHERDTLYWSDCTPKQARDVLQRNQISGRLFTEARAKLLHPAWCHGPHVYVIDTLTNKGARITIQGPDEYDIKVSSRTGEAVFDELREREESYNSNPRFQLLDKIVVMD